VRAASSFKDKVRPLPSEKNKMLCSRGNHTLDKEEEKKVKESKRKMSKVGVLPASCSEDRRGVGCSLHKTVLQSVSE
jgi:hypothetical protein